MKLGKNFWVQYKEKRIVPFLWESMVVGGAMRVYMIEQLYLTVQRGVHNNIAVEIYWSRIR